MWQYNNWKMFVCQWKQLTSCFLFFIQWPNSINHPKNARTSGSLEECVHSVRGSCFLLFTSDSCFYSSPLVSHCATCFLPDSFVAACVTRVYQRGDSGPPVCPRKQLRGGSGSTAETWHGSRVRPLCFKTHLLLIPAVLMWFFLLHFRVLLDNVNELIEMQMRNDSTDPRSGATYYEKYHSLDDVWLSFIFVLKINDH